MTKLDEIRKTLKSMNKTGIGDLLVQDLERVAEAIIVLRIHLEEFFVISGDPTAERPGGVIKASDVVSSNIRDLERELNDEKDKDG